jgi:hypothetical protein
MFYRLVWARWEVNVVLVETVEHEYLIFSGTILNYNRFKFQLQSKNTKLII